MVEVHSVRVDFSLDCTFAEVDLAELLDHLDVVFCDAALPGCVNDSYSWRRA